MPVVELETNQEDVWAVHGWQCCFVFRGARMECLPLELIFHIFNKLDRLSLVGASQTCSNWRNLVNDERNQHVFISEPVHRDSTRPTSLLLIALLLLDAGNKHTTFVRCVASHALGGYYSRLAVEFITGLKIDCDDTYDNMLVDIELLGAENFFAIDEQTWIDFFADASWTQKRRYTFVLAYMANRDIRKARRQFELFFKPGMTDKYDVIWFLPNFARFFSSDGGERDREAEFIDAIISLRIVDYSYLLKVMLSIIEGWIRENDTINVWTFDFRTLQQHFDCRSNSNVPSERCARCYPVLKSLNSIFESWIRKSGGRCFGENLGADFRSIEDRMGYILVFFFSLFDQPTHYKIIGGFLGNMHVKNHQHITRSLRYTRKTPWLLVDN